MEKKILGDAFRAFSALVAVIVCAFSAPTPAFGVEISPILEGKMAAFSFTYDDGAYSDRKSVCRERV